MARPVPISMQERRAFVQLETSECTSCWPESLIHHSLEERKEHTSAHTTQYFERLWMKELFISYVRRGVVNNKVKVEDWY